MSEVYLVGWSSVDSHVSRSIHATYDGAILAWNDLRNELIVKAKESADRSRKFISAFAKDHADPIKTEQELLSQCAADLEIELKNLGNKNPKTMSNGIAETPFIQTFELRHNRTSGIE